MESESCQIHKTVPFFRKWEIETHPYLIWFSISFRLYLAFASHDYERDRNNSHVIKIRGM